MERDNRELQRMLSVQSLLKGSNSVVLAGSSRSARGSHLDASSSAAGAGAREASTPVSPSSTSSRSSTSSTSRAQQSNQRSGSQSDSHLVRCPDKLLMHVFAYLDANSVFAVSLTNHLLLSRVHAMFGMTTSVAKNGTSARKPIPSTPKPRAAQQPSPKPRQPKGRSQSFMTQSEKEKAQVKCAAGGQVARFRSGMLIPVSLLSCRSALEGRDDRQVAQEGRDQGFP